MRNALAPRSVRTLPARNLQRARLVSRTPKFQPCATAAASSSAEPPEKAGFMEACWKFLRPHTIRGTILGTTAIVTTALLENPEAINLTLVPRALLGLLALLCGNGYIVGINQIYDKSIDIENKPYLPIAAGELSDTQGWFLCAGMAALGLAIVATQFESLIASLYAFGLFLGTIYSVPPLRLKQNPVAAFMIIACVRGFLLNFGVFHATRNALGFSFQWSPVIVFITCFVSVFATAIAITKDLPDIAGDRVGNIETFATKYGERAVTFLGAGLLLTNYIGAITAALMNTAMFNTPVMVGAHAILGLILIYRTWKLDNDQYTLPAIQKFYVWVWNLFYSEYFLLPWLSSSGLQTLLPALL